MPARGAGTSISNCATPCWHATSISPAASSKSTSALPWSRRLRKCRASPWTRCALPSGARRNIVNCSLSREFSVMSKYGIGQPVLRFEDPRLLRGQGRFINDVNLPGQAPAVSARSPHAHAKIRAIDFEEAKKAPGVVAVYTGHDVAADGL